VANGFFWYTGDVVLGHVWEFYCFNMNISLIWFPVVFVMTL
jgi:hypothetical protein